MGANTNLPSPAAVTLLQGNRSVMTDLIGRVAAQQLSRVVVQQGGKLAGTTSETTKEGELVKFLARGASRRHLYIMYDSEWPGSAAAVKTCSDAWVDVVATRCDSDLGFLERALHTTTEGEEMRIVIIFCLPERILDVFRMVRARSLESSTVQWVVVVVMEETQHLSTHLTHLLREGTQLAVLTAMADGGHQYVATTSFVDVDDTVRFEHRGVLTVSEEGSDLYLKTQLFPALDHLYRDFRGRQLVVSVLNNWPFFGLRYLPDGKPLADSGLDISVLNSLSHKFNFTYVVAEPEDGQWGGPQPDGSVTGIIGMVARHEAHLAINEITITAILSHESDILGPVLFNND
ncbi:uncharacterized protein LOC121864682 [Homarus americanus]|uniref:uncharacterized protein LOC121864682 n=1 Tax=Homarus americanus TaxID=6706 RepID=UPI001C45A932|nr:uncharacterized protein LOC121864682 [Homarus americanus]